MNVLYAYLAIGALLASLVSVLCAIFKPSIETGMFAILLVFVFFFWPLAALVVAVVGISEVL